MRAFAYNSLPSRVVFRAGALDDLAAEIERLGARSAGVYDKAVMHVPIETAEAAREVAKSLNAESLDEAARLATQNPYYNPRPIEYAAIRQLLQNAWEGNRPG